MCVQYKVHKLYSLVRRIEVKKNKKHGNDELQESKSFMKKKNNTPKPDVINMDEIALLVDDELISKINYLEDGRAKANNSGYDSYSWEVELAYFLRESQLRRARKEFHEKWLAEQISTINVDESNLPYADFDNLKYMVNLNEKARI